MRLGIYAVVIAAVVAGGLWWAGILGGGTVLGTSWLNGQSGGSSGDQVVLVIDEGGVPAELAPGTEVVIGPLDGGGAYCTARIIAQIDTPDGPGYTSECI